MIDRMNYLRSRIYPKQKTLENNLIVSDSACSIWTKTKSNKELSKGCQACKSGTWLCLFVGHKCNLDCLYCPQGSFEKKNTQYDHELALQDYWIDDIKRHIDSIPKTALTGVSYSGGEPLMYLSKIIDVANHLSKHHPHIYQWVYTNGVLADEMKLQILRDVGIKEIRFHIGASNFDKRVLTNLKSALKIIDICNIESPSTPELKQQLLDNERLKWFEDIGIQQLNLAELYLVDHDKIEEPYASTELYAYTSLFRGYTISPTISREITYDIIDYACQKNIDILINDCSNESRDVQINKQNQNQFKIRTFY